MPNQSIEYTAQSQPLFSTYESACNMILRHFRPSTATTISCSIAYYFPATSSYSLPTSSTASTETNLLPIPTFISAKKKYKPVACKVKPVLEDLPAKFCILRDIKGDPLTDLPVLTPYPPPFTPTGQYTQERKEQFDKIIHILSFLTSTHCSTTV